MPTVIDSIQIEIQSGSTNAASGIDSLAKSLEKLKNSGKITTVVKNLHNLSDSLKGFTDASGSASSLHKLANAIERLKGIGSIASITNNLTKLPGALKSIQSVDMGRVAPQLQDIADAARPLTEIKTSGLNGMVNALSKIGKVTADLDKDKIAAFAAKVKELNEILGPLSEKMATIKGAFGAINTGANRATKAVHTFEQGVNTTTLNLSSFIEVARTAAQTVANLVHQTVEFLHAAIGWDGVVAQFGNAFGDQADEYYNKITKITEALDINKQAFMENSAMSASMLIGFGVDAADAREMGLGYTELAYDVWAAYNNVYQTLDGADGAMAAIRSAIAGEVEPIRRAGFTIVESTLEQTAANHGLQISIESATEAQKSYLRYLTLVDQAQSKGIIGTYAREMNTAEGMMRTFSQQLKSLTQAFGSLFLPILVKVMPYVQAFVELLTEGVHAIAALFGVKIQDIGDTWKSYGTGVENAVEGTEGVTDALGDAAKAAKDLKKASIGIDELNVISPPSASAGSGGSGGGGAGGGFSDLDVESLWDESIFNEVKSQVDEIKERLKGWLPVITAIGGALGALGLASLLQSVGNSIKEMDKLNKIISSIGIATIEAVLVFHFADNYLESGNLLDLVGEAITTAAAGYLLYKAWGAKGLVLALGVSILSQLAAITFNVASGDVEMDDPQLWIQSAFTTALAGGAGGYLAYKGLIPIKSKGKGVALGLLAGASLTLAAITIGDITASGEVTAQNILTGIGSAVAAAGFGFMVGGPVGAVVGAGISLAVNIIGAVVGIVTKNAEKNLEEDLKNRFGSIQLDAESVEFYVDKITAIPRSVTIDTADQTTTTISVTAALDIYVSEKEVLTSLEKSIESTLANIDTQNVKIAIGMDVEYDDYVSAIDTYVSQAQEYLEQYYLTSNISIQILDSDSTGGLSTTLATFYQTASGDLADLGGKLKSAVSSAFVDGEWIPDKLQEALEIQQEMQEILEYVSNVEYRATMENLKLSVSGDALTSESFSAVMEGAQAAIEDRLNSLEEVKMSNLQVAVMEYDANIADGMSEAEAQKIYKQTVSDIETAYQNGRVEVTYGTIDFGFETIRTAFETEIATAKSEKWFDYSKALNDVFVLNPNDFEGEGGVYYHLELFQQELLMQIKGNANNLAPEARKSLEKVLKELEPTMADYNAIAEGNRKAGLAVPENVRDGINNFEELKALSGDMESINYLIGKGFSTDTAFLNTLATAENAGKQIRDEVRTGLLNNLEYVTDSATGVVTGIKNSITGEVIAVTPTLQANMKQMGVDLSTGLGDGIEEDEPTLLGKFSNWCSNIFDSIKNFFGIHSPSKKMMEVGGYLSDGLSNGMESDGIKTPLTKMWESAKTWWSKKPALSEYTPKIGDIKAKVSSAWDSAKKWYDSKKAALKEYTPSIGSIYDKMKTRWDNARTWWNDKKTKAKEYTPSIGSIYEKMKERWDNARTWWNSKKTAANTYTPSIGSIKDKLVSAWNTAKSWWNKNVGGLSTKLDIKVPKITVNWATASAFGKEFRYPTGFNLKFAKDGGVFDAGSLIWAGEHGAEILANAGGGRTGVMNIEQMQEAVYEGVYAAVTAAMSRQQSGGAQGVNVYLDSRQITSTVEQRQREKGASLMGNEVFSH